jgi:hypothetical protein
MTRKEQLITQRDTFDDAVAGKIDIHDWEAKTLTLITDILPSVEVKHAIHSLASNSIGGLMRNSDIAKIRSALACAIAEPDTPHSTSETTIPLTMAALREIPVTTSQQIAKKRPKVASSESGLFWIWYHSDASTLAKLIGIVLGSFGLGFATGSTKFLVELWGLLRKTFME